MSVNSSLYDGDGRNFLTNLAAAITCMLNIDTDTPWGRFYGKRVKSDLTYAAKKTGVSRTTLYTYTEALFDEDGCMTYGPKQISILSKLCRPYGISLSQLFYVAENADGDEQMGVALRAFQASAVKLQMNNVEAAVEPIELIQPEMIEAPFSHEASVLDDQIQLAS